MQPVAVAPNERIRRHGTKTLPRPDESQEACAAATAAIRELGRQRAWEASLAKIRELQLLAVRTDTLLHNAVISACERATRWSQALSALGALRVVRLVADVASFGTVVSCSNKKTFWSQAMRCLQESRCHQLQPNIISYNTALNSAIRAVKWQVSTTLFNDILAEGLQPSTITYNSAMMSQLVPGDWRQALAIASSMRLGLAEMDLISTGITTTAYACEHAWEVCLLALDSGGMCQQGPNAVVINAALGGCTGKGAWRIASCLLEVFRQFSQQQDSATFSSAAGSSSTAQEWESACFLVQQAVDKGMCDANLLDAAIRDTSRASWWSKTRSLLGSMMMRCIRADSPRIMACMPCPKPHARLSAVGAQMPQCPQESHLPVSGAWVLWFVPAPCVRYTCSGGT